MNPTKFLVASLCCFVGSVLAYFGAIDRLAIPRLPLGKSYRQFLLSASDGIDGRIVIESGSNSVYGIDALQIEKHFGRLTIVIADNAGYPLRHKIFRLRRHLRAGDTVILALEWLQYRTDSKLPLDYVQSMIDAEGSNAFYYRELPLRERFLFVLRDLPFVPALRSALSLNALPRWNPALGSAASASRASFREAILRSDRGSHMTVDEVPIEVLTASLACDNFLFGLFETPRVSPTFLDNLELLAKLRDETKANILLTWPAVVARDDDECYALLPEAIDVFVKQIEASAALHGFAFIGRKEQSRFDHRCMRDTYYHLRPECAAERTRVLIEAIEAAGAIQKAPRAQRDFGAALEQRLASLDGE